MYENGVDNVSIIDICKQASISRATFYAHFNAKENLITEYFESTTFLTKQLKNWIQSAANPWSCLVRLQSAYIQHIYFMANVELASHYLSYRLLNGNDDTSEKQNKLLSDLMLPLICEAQNTGIIQNPSDPFYLCNSVFLLYNGTLYDWCTSKGKSDPNRTFFWNLESIMAIHENYRGVWKLDENIPLANLLALPLL